MSSGDPREGKADGGAERISDAPTMKADESEGVAPTLPTPGGDEAFAPTVTPPSSSPGRVSLDDAPLEGTSFTDRYRSERVLGRGGMGEVRLLRDRRIGREVAMKVMRDGVGSAGGVRARFLREARVQGQLEHPAIVPVYDMGVGPDRAPYFTMKRLRGVTLERVLGAHAGGEDELARRHSRRKILTAFAAVCQAVEFAHSRGVIHRDLKPGNVMLGDFGATYVLDWGVARIADVPDAEGGEPLAVSTGATAAGAVLGTPGYMAPEQLRGEDIDPRADVYALGAILFEILTLEPLHPRRSTQEAVDSTLHGGEHRPSARAPELDVAPELDAICARATAPDPADRFASVAELHAELEAYLDGDRDLARRRSLALEHAQVASSALERALGAKGRPEDRTEAMREASRALALDPECEGAAAIVTRLMLEPPREVPAEVQEDIDRVLDAGSRIEARNGVWAYVSFLAFVPLFAWMGVRNWAIVAVMAVLVVAVTAQAYVASRSDRVSRSLVVTAVVLNSILLMLASRVFGPFVLIPVVAAASTIGFVFHSHVMSPRVPLVAGVLVILVPSLLEWTGVLEPSYVFTGDAMVLVPRVVELPETATRLALTVATAAAVGLTAWFVLSVRQAQVQAERRLHLQAWYLRHVVPEQAREAMKPVEPEPPECIFR